MATGAYSPYGATYQQRQWLAQASYPNQTLAAPKLQQSNNAYGTNYSTNPFTPKTYNTSNLTGNYGWGNATQANSWNYNQFQENQKNYLNQLNKATTDISNDYATWMNQVNSADNYGNTTNQMSYALNPQREYQQQMAYQNYLDSMAQNQVNAAARGLGYTGVAAGLDQRSNQTYGNQLLNIEAELNKLAVENALASISNQNTTGSEWLHAMLKQIDSGNQLLNSLGTTFTQGAGQASDYDKMMQQIAEDKRQADLTAQIEREKMANALAIANLNSGSRGGGGGGYSGGGYSSGGYSSGGGNGSASSKVGSMGVWNNATKTIDYIPATRAAYEQHFGTNWSNMANRRR